LHLAVSAERRQRLTNPCPEHLTMAKSGAKAATSPPEPTTSNKKGGRGVLAALVVAAVALSVALYVQDNNNAVPSSVTHVESQVELPVAAVDEPNASAITTSAKYKSKYPRSQSKRLGDEKKAAEVTFGSPTPPSEKEVRTQCDSCLAEVSSHTSAGLVSFILSPYVRVGRCQD
jgi:hypothetical protein